jgi:hypothetical protein
MPKIDELQTKLEKLNQEIYLRSLTSAPLSPFLDAAEKEGIEAMAIELRAEINMLFAMQKVENENVALSAVNEELRQSNKRLIALLVETQAHANVLSMKCEEFKAKLHAFRAPMAKRNIYR